MAKPGKAPPRSSSNSALPDNIPDKLYFRIGEVAELCGVETYVLRFWQTEFPQLAPKKSGTGQRLYRRRDVEQALRIKHLLHDKGYTIAGARGVLLAEAQEQRLDPRQATQPELALASAPVDTAETRQAREQADREADRAQTRLARLRLELRELHSMLSRAPSAPRHHARPSGKDESLLFEEEPGS